MKQSSFPSAALCLVLAVALLAPRRATAQALDSLWQKAQTAQRENRWDDAIRDFSTLAERYPTNANASVGLGYSYYKQAQLERAETYYRSALELDANHAGALFGLGQIALARKQWNDAAERFRDILRVAPKFEPLSTRHNLAIALEGAGQYGEAVKTYREALALTGKPSVELVRHALDSALAAEDFAQTQDWGEAATELYPQEARFWEALAWAYKIRKPEKARDAFTRAESLAYKNTEPTHKTVFSLPFRGRWRVTQGNGGEFTHRGLSARFAWDFEAVNAFGSTRSDDAPRGTNERSFSFGQDVLAPADGRVVALQNATPDNAPNHRSPSSHSGNYILLEHAPGEFSVLAHLQKDSIVVAIGDTVKRGQRLARCGNSGSTDLPHLHFGFLGDFGGTRISQPAIFSNYTVSRGGTPETVPSGIPAEGEVVQSAPVEIAPLPAVAPQ